MALLSDLVRTCADETSRVAAEVDNEGGCAFPLQTAKRILSIPPGVLSKGREAHVSNFAQVRTAPALAFISALAKDTRQSTASY